MSFTVLKTFQTRVVDNLTAHFEQTLALLENLRGSPSFKAQRSKVLVSMGNVLLEAPTGIGKTLMAGQAVGRISSSRKMLWVWFAPFGSVVQQTIGVLREEIPTLRVRDLATDRDPAHLRPGDLFVTTWASVAVQTTEARKARTGTETTPSFDILLDVARQLGYGIGAVVDEAHHSFRGRTQAVEFYATVVDPDVTLLITATPRDSDAADFQALAGRGAPKRVTVSRSEGVEARLLKSGVQTAVFTVANGRDGALVDFRRTALSQAVLTHRLIKERLAAVGQTLVPLLLVQVDSTPNSISEAETWLKEFGFAKDQVMVHTADEPDPGLNAVQGDERVEVLVFKMAVAQGFDAPRAFTLVSFRTSRDPSFGLQIVGRLMRVDRRLQRMADLPPELNHGYVFLSDQESQTGLMDAGARINRIRTEFASLGAPITVAFVDSGDPLVVPVDENGQVGLFAAGGSTGRRDLVDGPSTTGGGSAVADRADWFGAWGLRPYVYPNSAPSGTITPEPDPNSMSSWTQELHSLKHEPALPQRFMKAEVDVVNHDVLDEVVQRFRFDAEILLQANRTTTKVLMEEWDVFTSIKEVPTEIQAKLAQAEIHKRAEACLFAADPDGFLDPRALDRALLVRLTKEWGALGLDGHDDPLAMRRAFERILALRSDLLPDAVQETLARHTKAVACEDLPDPISEAAGVRGARLNLYGVFPSDLNRWERAFADLLDNDVTGTVLWWHRNPVRKPWSVCVPVPGQPQFYPDFLVGVAGRAVENNVLMVETKGQINDPSGNAAAKSQVRHPIYGRALMLHWKDETNWMTVEYQPSAKMNELDRMFRIEIMKSFG